jgi:hypothetical protein
MPASATSKSSGIHRQAHTGGEDAFFVSSAGHGAFAISDGVSAWALEGVDPGEYSRALVQVRGLVAAPF